MMRGFLLCLLSATVVSSALALVLLSLAPALRRVYSARAVSAAFLIVLLSFFALWRPQTAPTAVQVALPRAQISLPAAQPVKTESPVSLTKTPVLAQTNANSAAVPSVSLYDVLFLVWLSGAAAVLLFQAVRHLRFSRLIRRWQKEAPLGYQLLLDEAAFDMGLRRAPRIAVCPVVDGPMLCRVFHPIILIPQAHLSREELLPVLLHELSHFRRRDVLRKLLSMPVLCVHWFNPLAWLTARAQSFYAELACDERVISGKDFNGRKHYAQSILHALQGGGAQTPLSTSFRGGKIEMKKRIESVLDMRKKRMGTAMLCLLLTVALLSGAFALTEKTDAPDAQQALDQAYSRLSAEYSSFFFWPAEAKGAYSALCEQASQPTPDGHVYVTPNADDLTSAQVMDIVQKELKTDDFLVNFYVSMGFVQTDSGRECLVRLIPTNKTEADADCTFRLESPSGRVIMAVIPDNAVENAKRATEAFMTATTEKFDSLARTYGSDSEFWPLEIQYEFAQVGLYVRDELTGFSRAALPEATDLTKDDAQKIADGAFEQFFGGAPDAFVYGSKTFEIKRGTRFYVVDNDSADRSYIFSYWGRNVLQASSGYSVYFGSVTVSSPDGAASPDFSYTSLNAEDSAASQDGASLADKAKRQYTGEYGDFFFWPAEVKGAYVEFLTAEGRQAEADKNYVRPNGTDLEYDDALELVRVLMNASDIENYFSIGASMVQEADSRYWIIALKPLTETTESLDCTFHIESPSGRVLLSDIAPGAVDGAIYAASEKQRAIDKTYASLIDRYGSDSFLWPVSAKAEYAEVSGETMDIQGRKARAAVPTQADTLTSTQAQTIADGVFTETFGQTPEALTFEDGSVPYFVTRGVSFYESTSNPADRYYLIEYRADYESLIPINGMNSYLLGAVAVASPSGTVAESTLSQALRQEMERSSVNQNAFEGKWLRDGMWVTWSFEDIVKYRELEGYFGIDLYETARPGEISREYAIQTARAYIEEHCPTVAAQIYDAPQPLTKERVDNMQVCALLCVPTELSDAPYWQVFLYETEWFKEGMLDSFDVHMNAQTGEVTMLFEPGGNG